MTIRVRCLLPVLAGFTAVLHLTQPAAAQRRPPLRADPQVRVWSLDDRDMFRNGEPMRILFRTTDDAYVAVFRIDTRGQVELLFPIDPRDHGYVPGRLTHRVRPPRHDYWRIDEPPGIAYVFAVASAEPLTLRAFRYGYSDRDPYDGGDRYSGRDRYGRSIHGDPFFEIDRIAGLVVRDRHRLPAVDVFSYFVDGRHDYPSYACYDAASAPSYRGPAYPDCDWLRASLRRYPDYYDTRRFQGERNVFDRTPRREDLRR